MIVNKGQLLRELVQVQGGLAAKPTVEQSDCFVFQKGEVMTYNDDVACRIPCSLKITGAINASKMFNMLSRWPEETIEFKREPGKLRYRGKSKSGYFVTQDEIILPIKDVDQPKQWYDLPSNIWESINLVIECASRHNDLSHLDCVHFTENQIEACDGQQAARIQVNTPYKNVLIQQISIRFVMLLNPTKTSEGSNWVHFRTGDTGVITSCRKCMENYPTEHLDRIFNLTGSSLVLPNKGLTECISRLEVFLEENYAIEVDLFKNELKLTSRGEHGCHTEREKIKYNGTPISFNIYPKLLKELIKKDKQCIISDRALKATHNGFQYITVLMIRDRKEE